MCTYSVEFLLYNSVPLMTNEWNRYKHRFLISIENWIVRTQTKVRFTLKIFCDKLIREPLSERKVFFKKLQLFTECID